MLKDTVQTMPVSEVHILALSPHTHVVDEVCAAEPSAGLHTRAVAEHRQERLLYPQSREESASVLNVTADPPLFEKQPRGSMLEETEFTLVSLNPSAVLACWHVA